jgi:DNA-directed RNA polymerase specialized sigma24 family protein
MHQIIARWSAGDATAPEELYREYFHRVKEFISMRGANIIDSLQDIRTLRPAFRQVVPAKHLQGLNDPEASLQLQLPEATHRVRLLSAHEILRCDAKADFSRARVQHQSEKD